MYCRLVIILFLLSSLLAQESIYTNGSYNGFAWNNMFINSKLNLITSMLDRWRYEERPVNNDSDSNCVKILKQITTGRIKINVSLRDIVGYLNSFYSEEQNMEIPIVSSYCTIVKNISGYGLPYRKESTDSLRVLFRKGGD
jgi:hypothetical protein